MLSKLDTESSHLAPPPQVSRPVASHEAFSAEKWAPHNATECPGLENAVAETAYTNSIILALFYVPEVRESVLAYQYTQAAYGQTKSALTLELGFLFHMLEQHAAGQAAPPGTPCHSGNFLRTLKQMPEVLALGLLVDESNPGEESPNALLRRAHQFHRFLLRSLSQTPAGAASEMLDCW